MNNHSHHENHASRWIVVLISLLICCAQMSYGRATMPDTELNELNMAMCDAGEYRARKMHHIDSLVNVAHRQSDATARFNSYMAIGREYHTFIADSALHYYKQAEDLAESINNRTLEHSADIALVGAMSVAGFFNEASAGLDSLERLPLTADQRLALWTSARQLYSSLTSYVGKESPIANIYRDRYLAIDDSLLNHLPGTTDEYRFIYAERLVGTGQYTEAGNMLQKILSTNPINANIYGKAAYQLAMVYLHQGNEQMYAAFLAKAAISDIAGCVTEGWALPMLAEWLFRQGELDRAFTYINYALSEAMAGNARMRTSVISGMVPTIDEAYRKKLMSSRDQLVIYLCLATFLFLITTLMAIFLFVQIRKSHRVQKRLRELSHVQELYLANFVALCSNYSARLRSWQKMVIRKLTSNQTDDLLKTIKAGKITDENDDFHSVMDQALLEIYPNLVEEINALLRPDEQIELHKPGTMTPELRIYALIRMGVTESTRIATILQYSTNTIYTYRNKMRNRAIDRTNFDRQVRNLGEIALTKE